MAKTAKSKSNPSASTADVSPPTNAPAARPTEEQIAVRAYHIYLERGDADGNPMDDWLQAERELTEGGS
jgi:hypothetical protein